MIAAVVLLIAAAWTISTHGQTIAIAAIHGYQQRLAPLAARAGARCRFTPTCSRYAETVITRDGVMRGGWRALKRIARCGPWTTAGTRDEP
jgi:putative membrane protein insertion efficiency factor